MTQKHTLKPAKKIFGEIKLPGDKSISHRAIMLGSLAKGSSRIGGLSESEDCSYTIHAFKAMGVEIEKRGGFTLINGKGLKGLDRPKGPIYTGESGTTMRLLAGILAGQDFESKLEGGRSLSSRPMDRIVRPLTLMGSRISCRKEKFPPITISGQCLKPIDYRLPVASAQVKSAILFAALNAAGKTTVKEDIKSRDHTERMMKLFGADISVRALKVELKGQRELRPRTLEIPSDISSAAFFIAASTLLKGSKVKIRGVGINPTRAGIIKILKLMKADIEIVNRKMDYEPSADIAARYKKTRGIIIKPKDIPSIIDELPIIFVLATLSEGVTVIKGAEELRVKETDRIASMKRNLKSMGAKIGVKNDAIIIEGVEKLHGANLKSCGDHRTAMAMAIASLAAEGESTIDDIGCVSKSFPSFFKVLDMAT